MSYRQHLDRLMEQARYLDRVSREAVKEEGAAALGDMFEASRREQAEKFFETSDMHRDLAARRRQDEADAEERHALVVRLSLFPDEFSDEDRARLDTLGGATGGSRTADPQGGV